MRDMQEAARTNGRRLAILKASTESEIDTAFAALTQLHAGRSSSGPIRSSTIGASSSWRWRHAMPFRQSTSGVNSPRLAV